MEEDPRMNSVVLEEKGTIFHLNAIMCHQAHLCILDNSTIVEELRRAMNYSIQIFYI